MTDELRKQIVEWASTCQDGEYVAFVEALERIAKGCPASLIPMSNMRLLVTFGYFDSIDTRKWARKVLDVLLKEVKISR